MPIQVFSQGRQTICQQLHPLVLQPILQVKQGKKMLKKWRKLKKLEEIKRDTFSSLEELEEQISSVIPMGVIKVRGDEHILLESITRIYY